MSGEPRLTVLPASNRHLLEAARTVLATADLPPVVLIGGLAVTARVAAAGARHRATRDIDLVTTYREPQLEAAELIAAAHHSGPPPLVIKGVKVDLIETNPISDSDLEGLADRDHLFLAGHRWAFETAQVEQLAMAGADPLAVSIATPAGLVAAKTHAVGYPSSTRRSTKHGADLLDLLRLVGLYDTDGSVTAVVRAGPTELARIVADVCEREITSNPASATNKIASAAPDPVEVDDVASIIGDFVSGLRR